MFWFPLCNANAIFQPERFCLAKIFPLASLTENFYPRPQEFSLISLAGGVGVIVALLVVSDVFNSTVGDGIYWQGFHWDFETLPHSHVKKSKDFIPNQTLKQFVRVPKGRPCFKNSSLELVIGANAV